MEHLVGILTVIVMSAFIVDWVLKDDAISSLPFNTKVKSEAEERSELIVYANDWFRDLFDAIYGKETWSWKRFIRSVIMSFFFVLFAILVIGIDNTYFERGFFPFELSDIVVMSIFFLCINFFVDFISLQETRWVIGYAKGRKNRILGGLIVVDLIFTSLIYIFVFIIAIFIVAWYLADTSLEFEVITSPATLGFLFRQELGLPFFVSTFGTSIVWYMFVIFVIVVSNMNQKFEKFSTVFDLISNSTSPASKTVVIFALPAAIILGVVMAIKWLILN